MMLGWQEWVQVLAGFAGTLGFGVLFNIRGRRLLLAAFGGFLSWLLFLVLGFFIRDEVVRYFIVSIAVSIYAEVLARIVKTPTTTFCIISLIPLIPGGSLYYTMRYALEGQSENFVQKAVYTLALAAALSLGIVLVSATMRYVNARRK